jgi:hypothetical protein
MTCHEIELGYDAKTQTFTATLTISCPADWRVQGVHLYRDGAYLMAMDQDASTPEEYSAYIPGASGTYTARAALEFIGKPAPVIVSQRVDV